MECKKPFDKVLDFAYAAGFLIGDLEKWRKVITKGEKIKLISALKNRNKFNHYDDFETLIWKIRTEKESLVYQFIKDQFHVK